MRPIVGSALGHDLGGPLAWSLDGGLIATVGVAEDAIGDEPGQRVGRRARVSSTLGVHAFRVGVGAEASTESAETWSGTIGIDGNRGRTDTAARITARWSSWPSWGLFASGRVPLYAHTVGAQPSHPAAFQIGSATAFDLVSHPG